ncbi:MAG: MATE family efflux transporter, partial [Hyphomonadaceae bacterium]
SVAVAIAGYALTPVILGAMGTPPAARAEAVAYLRMIFFALPFMYFFNYVQMAQRGAGDARTPLYFSMLAVGLDIALNPLLIIGVGPFPKMGIEGSAAATLVAQATSLALLMAHLYRRRSILVLEREELSYLRPDPAILRTLIMRGLPMGLQMIVISSAAIAMISVVNRYGVDTAAGYAAASQLWTYVQMPAMAVAAAVSSMAAQNIGARRWDRVDQIARRGVPLGLIATATPVAIIYVFNRQFLHLFLPEGAALAIAQHINFHVMWGFVAFSVTFVLFGVVRANGAVVVPLAMLICSIWLLRVPLASIGSLYFGPDAIWWSFPTGTCFSAVLATLYYKFGGWRKARLMAETAGGEAADTGLSPPAIADEAIAENAEERPAAR